MRVESVLGVSVNTVASVMGLLLLQACMSAPPRPAPVPSPPPVEAPAPKVVVVQAPAQPEAADLAARRLIAYHEQIRQLSPQDLANEINRLNAAVSATPTAAPPDVVLELALALSQQHNGGDVARAVALLEPITRSSAPELAPWQPLARLLLGRVLEQRRLEEALNREATRNREQQRTLQQLNEKLEALKAIERSMANRPPSGGPAPATPAAPAVPPPAAPKTP